MGRKRMGAAAAATLGSLAVLLIGIAAVTRAVPWVPAPGTSGRPAPAAATSGLTSGASSRPGPPAEGKEQPDRRAADLSYATLSARLVAEVDRQDPGVALHDLDATIRRNPGVARFCHPVAHDIGHAALAKYHGDFAKVVSYQNDVCGSGYLHGAVEHKLEESHHVAADVLKLCAPKNAGSCLHGIGHGAMYAANMDLPKAIKLCDEFRRDSQRARCGEGVFMQNFSTELHGAHPSRYLRPADPLYPCSSQRPVYQGPCYFYAPIFYLQLHPHAYAPALAWCRTAPANGAGTCTVGVGSRLMKYNIDRERWVEQQCHRGTAWQREPCVRGMVSYYRVHYHSDDAAARLCRLLDKRADVAVCRKAAGGPTQSVD
jgi:hypothetical protein